jgi:hypothetical protein
MVYLRAEYPCEYAASMKAAGLLRQSMRRLMLSTLGAIAAAGTIVAGEVHGVVRAVVCCIITSIARSMVCAAQQPKGDRGSISDKL